MKLAHVAGCLCAAKPVTLVADNDNHRQRFMAELDIDLARHNMIEQQIRPWEVLDPRVLEVIADTPRERFVPERYRALAFSDLEIPLPGGEVMMPPKLEARLLQALNVLPGDHVLEIGTGSGYLTACLARLGKHVDTIEIHADSSNLSRQLLAGLGIENIDFQIGDAFTELDTSRRYDVIAVTGSLPEDIADFRELLAIGGRQFVIVGEAPLMEARLVRRCGEDVWEVDALFETSIPRLRNCPHTDRFVL